MTMTVMMILIMKGGGAPRPGPVRTSAGYL